MPAASRLAVSGTLRDPRNRVARGTVRLQADQSRLRPENRERRVSSEQTRRSKNREQDRLADEVSGRLWRRWGPYLSDRQWGTVREDYSPHGTAWEYLPHDHARSRAYRWGEDGIAGLSDDKQLLCFSLALWNGRDPILKERLYGLTGNEGNHGEDVKEIYYYLDNTPTHSYMRMLYKYPQSEYPYTWLAEENGRRGKEDREFELLDTGAFDDDRYFDVFVEYAKGAPEDLLIRIRVHNRGSDDAELHLVPQIFFRNTWSWEPDSSKPELSREADDIVLARHEALGEYRLYCDGSPELLFTENETNVRRLLGDRTAPGPFKDAFHDYLVAGLDAAVSPEGRGTKAAAHYRLSIGGGKAAELRLRLTRTETPQPFLGFADVFSDRKAEADEFYADLQQGIEDSDARRVHRQALAGLLWTKQWYGYDVARWLEGDPGQPSPPPERKSGRNSDWTHLNNADILSMPDKWEFPWYAAWDLAFHCLPLALVDPAFAKDQLVLMTREWYMHPSGQLPAYEWAFGDVNPPVHAWATWRVYKIDKARAGGEGDQVFLERVFHKLLLNYTWWVNQKDADGHNLFQGGFLGLDNIGVFDRSSPLPTGGHLEQADGTSWMAMYSLNMMQIALELAETNPVYQDLATKFFEQFLHIAGAMANIGGNGLDLWDEEDGFFYDVLHVPQSAHETCREQPLKVRSIVGLIPLFAVETLEPDLLDRVPEFKKRLEWFLENRPDLASLVSRWHEPGSGERRLLSLLRGSRMKRLLVRMLDENEFLSDYGVRALSRYHADHPYIFRVGAEERVVRYEAAESNTGMFGGNSNWRGPIWFPINYLLVESLQKFHHYYGDEFKIECPTGSGCYMTIDDVACDLSRRLASIFLRDEEGHRAVFGEHEKLQFDPQFRDHILFYEYFHGDSGRGVGASHQTGWTALIAKLLQPKRGSGSRGTESRRQTRREGTR